MDSNLKDRLEKIQRLMENAGTVGEAEAAAAAFQRLVMKHNIDLAELGGDEPEEYVFDSIDLKETKATGLKWRTTLLNVLAKYNFCLLVVNGRLSGGRLTLVGKPANVAAVKAMFTTMHITFERLCAQGWKDFNRQQPTLAAITSGRTWRKSYLLGVPSGLYDKFKAEREEELVETPAANAIVLVSEAELQQAVDDYFGGLRSSKPRRAKVNTDAYGKGYEAGKNYSDAKPVRAGNLALSNGS